MKFVIISSLVASAVAFTPSSSTRSAGSALAAKSKYADELGAQIPLGYWDPMGIMNVNSDEKFDYFREVEIVHGRVAVRKRICPYEYARALVDRTIPSFFPDVLSYRCWPFWDKS